MAYINNPVRLTVAYTDHNDTTNNKTVSFHQLIVTVTATCGTDTVKHTFSSPCANTGSGTVDFDIHTCLQAAAENYPWQPAAAVMSPTVTYSYTAKEEWLLDGESRSKDLDGGSGSALVGGLTDRERLTGVALRTTSKPVDVSPQIASKMEVVIIGGKIVGTDGTQVYRLSESLDDNPDRYLLHFINRYGCMESISVECLRETEMNVDVSDYAISRPETLTQFSRARYSKQNDYETWKLSSGPVDRAWQQWFAHELLMAEYVWLYVGDMWQRVHIVPEDTVTLVNRSSRDVLTVQFSVRFDINGSVE